MEVQQLFALCGFMSVVAVSFFQKVDGHVCIPEERIDPSTGMLRWSIPQVERCDCQGVVVPRTNASEHQTCNKNNDIEMAGNAEFWFFDDIQPLVIRENWTKQKLDTLLDRDECYVNECESQPCAHGALCYDRFGKYVCQCRKGFEGINCETDTEAPTVICPANISPSINAHQANDTIYYNVSVTDNTRNNLSVSCSQESGSQFEIGETIVSCHALDEAGNSGICSFIVDIKDGEAPVITCPGNISTSADPGQATARVAFYVRAMDNSHNDPKVACSKTSGSQFEIGVTIVTCEAQDESTNSADCVFSIAVKDLEAPIINCPGNISAATNLHLDNATVVYDVDATDNSGIYPKVSCSKVSGSQFEIGHTIVECEAFDEAKNLGKCFFYIDVKGTHQEQSDIEAPTISCPDNISINHDAGEATTIVLYHTNATDNTHNDPEVSCSKASGSLFEIGQTLVSCQAMDEAGNAGRCSFTVDVEDVEAPTIICPGNINTTTDQFLANATIFYNVSAMDNSGENPNVTCSRESGDRFDLGETNVSCQALDKAVNPAICSFTVSVKDFEAPIITCRHRYQDKDKIFYNVYAKDNSRNKPNVSCSKESGSLFKTGETNVTCVAMDEAANSAKCLLTLNLKAYSLGMQGRTIADDQISASSSYSSSYPPHYARYYYNYYFNNNYGPAWYPASNDTSPWIHVSFKMNVTIERLMTQGLIAHVKTLQIQTGYSEETLSYIMDGNKTAEFKANSASKSIETIILPELICTSHLRIHPITWSVYCALRFEVIGFRQCIQKELTV